MQQTQTPDYPERSSFTAALVTAGVLAVLGFALPVLVGERLIFLNLEVFKSGSPVPGILKVLLLYPLLAGIFTIVVGAVARGVARAVTLLGLGLLTVALQIVGASEFSNALMPGVARLPGDAQATLLVMLLGFAGWSMLYAGSLVASLAPSGRLPKVIAGIGGGIFLLHLLLPVLPSEAGSLLLVTPVKALFRGGADGLLAGVMAIVLLSMALNVTASVLGCVLAGTGPRSLGLSRTAAILARIGIFLLLLFPAVIAAVAPGINTTERIATLTLVAKMLCWNIGIYAILPLALADLLSTVALAPSRARPTYPGYSPPPYTRRGYPPGYGEIPAGWPEVQAPPPAGGPHPPMPGAWANYAPTPGGAHPAAPPVRPPHPAPPHGPVPGGYPYPPQGQGPFPAQAPPPQDPRVVELNRLLSRGMITLEEYHRRLRALR
ncbi:MAG: hypothetical protein KA419_11115 [Acidobacteria bacterium]|nr:hypothetical protein [Acidobacteriota bacterium]